MRKHDASDSLRLQVEVRFAVFNDAPRDDLRPANGAPSGRNELATLPVNYAVAAGGDEEYPEIHFSAVTRSAVIDPPVFNTQLATFH